VQRCLVPLLRNRVHFVNGKQREPVAAALRPISPATTAEAAEQRLAAFEPPGEAPYATIGQLWRRHGTGLVSLVALPGEIRRILDTTNAVASWPMTLRQGIKTRASLPSQEAARKRRYRAGRKGSQPGKPSPNGRTALNHFMLLWGERLEAAQPRPVR
jgi:putative transposase